MILKYWLEDLRSTGPASDCRVFDPSHKLIRVEPAQYWPVKNRKGGEYKEELLDRPIARHTY